MMTDVQLAGNMNGVELAHIAHKHHPDMGLIVTSGRQVGTAYEVVTQAL